jgi:hypothetical protein
MKKWAVFLISGIGAFLGHVYGDQAEMSPVPDFAKNWQGMPKEDLDDGPLPLETTDNLLQSGPTLHAPLSQSPSSRNHNKIPSVSVPSRATIGCASGCAFDRNQKNPSTASSEPMPNKNLFFLELGAGLMAGSFRSVLRVNNWNDSANLLGNNPTFPGELSDRASAIGFSGALQTSFFRCIRQKWAIGASISGSVLSCGGDFGYPSIALTRAAGNAINYAVPNMASVKINDKGYVGGLFNVGFLLSPVLTYISVGWAGHFLSGKVWDASQACIGRLPNKMANCLVAGLSMRARINNKIWAGISSRCHFLGKSTFHNYGSKFLSGADLSLRVKPILVECLGVISYDLCAK